MIEYITKDITTVERGIICHGVNCQHKMASGVAKAIRAKWPSAYTQYMDSPKGKSMLGVARVVDINETLFVINCYTQIFYGYGGGRYADPEGIRRAMVDAMTMADYQQLPIYMPKIGCGLGGLDWDKEVKPVLEKLNTFFDQVEINVCELGE
jgi:O-acetyl-ADP-ribose deacetylase (regulator of RNase III)